MLCSNCRKREVEILVKQVVNNEVRNLNLCRVCAEEMGFISPDIPSITISFSLGEADSPDSKKLLRPKLERKDSQYDLLTCASCGTKYSEFRISKLLGCPACYESFRFPLGAFLQKEQGAESHWVGSEAFTGIKVYEEISREIGRTRERVRNERELHISRLKREMADAVLREEYERAAELKNKLRPLLCESDEEDDN